MIEAGSHFLGGFKMKNMGRFSFCSLSPSQALSPGYSVKAEVKVQLKKSKASTVPSHLLLWWLMPSAFSLEGFQALCQLFTLTLPDFQLWLNEAAVYASSEAEVGQLAKHATIPLKETPINLHLHSFSSISFFSQKCSRTGQKAQEKEDSGPSGPTTLHIVWFMPGSLGVLGFPALTLTVTISVFLTLEEPLPFSDNNEWMHQNPFHWPIKMSLPHWLPEVLLEEY